MLIYKIDVLEALKQAGYNTNRIRQEKHLNESALQYIREGKPIGPKPLNKLCELLNCQPGDIMEYIPDEEEQV
ncbi:helix-turn-helix domain-containing protein [Lacrimispora sp.]|uniref:helix-turn-helix domain-containing protein n=1 Tax=Lacrimispora sp. TaxID=2719234 RepID=UPI0028A8FA79|nr:helix-turn-helix domain-containing protein [Lacrimispora sp.]